MAENYLHIGGRSVEWQVGYADPQTIARELREHAASMGREVRLGFARVGLERGRLGSSWWALGSHLSRFKITDRLPWED